MMGVILQRYTKRFFQKKKNSDLGNRMIDEFSLNLSLPAPRWLIV